MDRAADVLEKAYADALNRPWSAIDWGMDALWMARQYFPSKLKLMLGGHVEEGKPREWARAPVDR
jgi:hypothetical protein